MTRSIIPTLFASAALISLSACATLPTANPLVAGIDEAQVGKSYAGLRAANDPVCVTLYDNMATYTPPVKKRSGGSRFLQSMAINVLASAATGGIVSGIASPVASMAAGTAISSASSAAGNAVIGSMSNPNAAKDMTKAAASVGCPMPNASIAAI